jgi:hypothetical protein
VATVMRFIKRRWVYFSVAAAAAVLVAILVLTVREGANGGGEPSATLHLGGKWHYVTPGETLGKYFSFIERCYGDCPAEEWQRATTQEAMDSELYSTYFGPSPVGRKEDGRVALVSLVGSPPPWRGYFYSLPFEVSMGLQGSFAQAGTIRGYPAVAVWYTSEAFGDGFDIFVLERLPTDDKPGIYTRVPASYSVLDTSAAEEIIDGRNPFQ